MKNKIHIIEVENNEKESIKTILENINVDIKEVNKFVASTAMESNEDIIYSKKSTKFQPNFNDFEKPGR